MCELAGVHCPVNIFQLFIKDNQSGDEVTQIDYLAIYGSPLNTTNMQEFKRVSHGLDHVISATKGALSGERHNMLLGLVTHL